MPGETGSEVVVPRLSIGHLLDVELDVDFDDRPAAALIYGRNKHIINLFTWPSTAQVPETTRTRNGYHMESWSSNGMAFWAVSDLNEGELREFVTLYRSRH